MAVVFHYWLQVLPGTAYWRTLPLATSHVDCLCISGTSTPSMIQCPACILYQVRSRKTTAVSRTSSNSCCPSRPREILGAGLPDATRIDIFRVMCSSVIQNENSHDTRFYILHVLHVSYFTLASRIKTPSNPLQQCQEQQDNASILSFPVPRCMKHSSL